MIKIPWFFIPITIIYFIAIFIILIVITVKYFINKFNKDLQVDMNKLCKKYDIDPIIPFSNGNVSQFNKTNALSFLNINYAISSWSGCKTELPTIDKFTLVKSFQGYDYAAGYNRDISALYYSKTMNIAIISFSGTMYLTEWQNDFDFGLTNPTEITNNTDVLIHEKDYIMYKSMRNDFINAINGVKDSNTIFVATGHSLGAALASICFLDIISNNIIEQKNRTLYSFASPRVGNVEFANILNKEPGNLRITNTEDIITDIPLPIMGKHQYEHTNTKVCFSMNLGDYASNHIDSYVNFLQ